METTAKKNNSQNDSFDLTMTIGLDASELVKKTQNIIAEIEDLAKVPIKINTYK